MLLATLASNRYNCVLQNCSFKVTSSYFYFDNQRAAYLTTIIFKKNLILPVLTFKSFTDSISDFTKWFQAVYERVGSRCIGSLSTMTSSIDLQDLGKDKSQRQHSASSCC
jgi:hypothetical protein